MERLPPSEPETIEAVSARLGLSEVVPERANHHYSKWFKRAAIGATAVAAMGIAAWKHWDKSGTYELLPPTVQTTVKIDSEERILTWNVAGQAAERHNQIRLLAKRYDPDEIALQEVDTADVQRLHHDFPKWSIFYALADQKQHLTEGGYGNVLMTRQTPTDIKTHSFAGTSLVDSAIGTVTGVGTDVVSLNPALTSTRDGWQERRVALAETTKVLSGDNLVDFRTIDVHISGNSSVHERQLSQAMDFIKSNIKDGRPMAVCGDFNAHTPEVTAAFASIGMVTPTKQGINSNFNGDYCGYYMAGETTTLAHVTVLNDFRTDHYPLEFVWSIPPLG